jgi:hypothetical protein
LKPCDAVESGEENLAQARLVEPQEKKKVRWHRDSLALARIKIIWFLRGRFNFMKPGIYKHSKTGNLYKVHFVAKHSETVEEFVVYEALYENPRSKFWVRPAEMFGEMVEINGEKVPRFVFIKNN